MKNIVLKLTAITLMTLTLTACGKAQVKPQTETAKSSEIKKTSKPSKKTSATTSSSTKRSTSSEQATTTSKADTQTSSMVAPASSETTQITPQTVKEETTSTPSTINVDAIAAGDFSSLAGTWQNADGISYTFDSKGLVSEEYILIFNLKENGNLYFTLNNKASGANANFMLITEGQSAPGGTTYDRDVLVVGQSVSDEEKPFYKQN